MANTAYDELCLMGESRYMAVELPDDDGPLYPIELLNGRFVSTDSESITESIREFVRLNPSSRLIAVCWSYHADYDMIVTLFQYSADMSVIGMASGVLAEMVDLRCRPAVMSRLLQNTALKPMLPNSSNNYAFSNVGVN